MIRGVYIMAKNSVTVNVGLSTSAKVTGSPDTKQQESNIKRLKAEISRKASMANKRIKRLEKNGLTDTPAYQSYVKHGGHKFSVKGKSYNELQGELSRVNHFIDSKTSTVRGANSVLKDLAKATGIKYDRVSELRSKSSEFFQIASKVNQYLNNLNGVASAIQYQKVWQQINEYVQTQRVDLGSSLSDVESIANAVSQILANQQQIDAENSIYDTFQAIAHEINNG